VIIVALDIGLSLAVICVTVTTEAQHQKFVIRFVFQYTFINYIKSYGFVILFIYYKFLRTTQNVSVKLMFMVKHVIYAKMEHLIYKKRMMKDVQNVSALVRLHGVKAPIFTEQRYLFK